jgi:hypothetical protein
MTKSEMCEALRRFINQRSGIDFRNYWTSDCWNSRTDAQSSFNADYRPMLRHGKQARELLRWVEWHDSITAEMLKDASRAYSGRLQFTDTGVEYTTGQYFPTEYRKAACAVLSQAIWDFLRDSYQTAEDIRKAASREFGRSIASTWFN